MLRPRRTFAALSTLLLLSAGCEAGDAEPTPAEAVADSVAPLDPQLLAAAPEGTPDRILETGRELFVTCTVCHGLDASGTALGPSLRDTVWTHGDGSLESIEGIIRSGVWSPRDFEVPMPEMGGGDFDADQLNALAMYVYALSRAAS